MNIKQTATYLQMNKMTVYKLARDGRIPAFKVASEWRFRKDLIDAWLMDQVKGNQIFERLSSEQHPRGGKTVLIVDDDVTIQAFFERALKDYRVTRASCGKEALAIIRKNRPDLVLLDLLMPGIDGIETLRRIKEIDEDIPVIMLSAYGTLQTNLEAAKLGAYTSLAKPFDLVDMQRIIADALVSMPQAGTGSPSSSLRTTRNKKKWKKDSPS